MSAGRQLPVPASARPGPQTRLPWWALLLPALAFVALFSLLSTPAAAAGGTEPGGSTLARVVRFVEYSAGHWAP
ncbi:hypothetical protein [Streptomyces sp. C36]|uniref:hypothetical protein n=1 Tax=Streptomyces sp. C36 TaxID=3237122 RepID=UPI0034C655BB